MQLRQVSVEGYRSIRKRLDLPVDDLITVILGANDHGKTNLLAAIKHLNPEESFDPDNDLNDDRKEEADQFPRIYFTFALDDDERRVLLKKTNAAIQLETIAEFREGLNQQVDEAQRAVAEIAGAVLATAEAPAVESAGEASAADGAPEGAASGDPTSAENATLVRAAAEADERLTLARNRALLGQAEELRIRAELAETQFDIHASVEEAQRTATTAKGNATRWGTKSEQAAEAFAVAQTAHLEDSEEFKKAKTDSEAAAQQVQSWAREVQNAVAELETLQSVADAIALAEEGKVTLDGPGPPKPKLVLLQELPDKVTFSRVGINGELRVDSTPERANEAAFTELLAEIPRVELIEPQSGLSDEVTSASIRDDNNDFMRGIFRYAGIAPEEWDDLFVENLKTRKRLDRANSKLNLELRKAWKQGKELTFELRHANNNIDLMIDDPSVTTTYVRASRRSSGFTHFFALKTVLHAREGASDASSFIWLFDEPGLWLHPDGQHDLLQVLETLSRSNQIIYSTHSIFLVNKNHPTRHRLLRKNDNGTELDKKPYANQWRTAIDALGLALPGTFLFASKVLLVEGDSDPILIYADLQKLIALGAIEADINSLSIMATGNSKHADALIRVLLDSAIEPTIGLLFDGDQGGKNRTKSLDQVIKANKLQQHTLSPKLTTAEDHVLAPMLFRNATIAFLESVCEDSSAKSKIRDELNASFETQFGSSEPKGLAKWSRAEGERILGHEPSSVGIAREYARLLAAAGPEELPAKPRRAIDLARKIAEMLELPSQLVEPRIVESV